MLQREARFRRFRGFLYLHTYSALFGAFAANSERSLHKRLCHTVCQHLATFGEAENASILLNQSDSLKLVD